MSFVVLANMSHPLSSVSPHLLFESMHFLAHYLFFVSIAFTSPSMRTETKMSLVSRCKYVQLYECEDHSTIQQKPKQQKTKAALPAWLQSVNASLHTLWAVVVYKRRGGRVSESVYRRPDGGKKISFGSCATHQRDAHWGHPSSAMWLSLQQLGGSVQVWKAEGKIIFEMFEFKWIFWENVDFCMYDPVAIVVL